MSICLTSAVTLLHLHLQDEFLHTRLSLQPDLSLVEQDLEFLSDVSLRFELPPIQSPYISSLFIHPGTGGEVKQSRFVAAGRPAEARGGPGAGAAQLAGVEAGGGGQGRPRRAGQGQAWRHMAGEHILAYGIGKMGKCVCVGIWANGYMGT